MARMGYIARGLYRELLDEQWLKGFIPNDITLLAEIADCPEEIMRSEWPRIATQFEELSPGRLVNPKLEEMRTASDIYRVRQAQFGRQGGRPRTHATESGLEKVGKADVKATLSLALGSADATLTEAEGKLSQKRKRREEGKERQVPVGTVPARVATEEFADAWNRSCGRLPKVRDLTEGRRKKLRARMAQGITVAKFAEVVCICAATPFLTGDNPRGWHADFDWLIENDTNIAKVMEGKYDSTSPRVVRDVPKPLTVEQSEAMRARNEAEERQSYAAWLGTSEAYRAANPWTGRVFDSQEAQAVA